MSRKSWFSFFFQAEDGIRDLTVTGVQTVLFRSNGMSFEERHAGINRSSSSQADALNESFALYSREVAAYEHKIGRASCRERVWSSVVAVSLKKRRMEEGARRRVCWMVWAMCSG